MNLEYHANGVDVVVGNSIDARPVSAASDIDEQMDFLRERISMLEREVLLLEVRTMQIRAVHIVRDKMFHWTVQAWDVGGMAFTDSFHFKRRAMRAARIFAADIEVLR